MTDHCCPVNDISNATNPLLLNALAPIPPENDLKMELSAALISNGLWSGRHRKGGDFLHFSCETQLTRMPILQGFQPPDSYSDLPVPRNLISGGGL